MTERKLGWVPDTSDNNDYPYLRPKLFRMASALPPIVDLRPTQPPIYDQAALSSCVGHGVARAFQTVGHKAEVPSRLFIYYNARLIEDAISSDDGAMIRDGMKAVAKWGAPPETLWAYEPSMFATAPPIDVYETALTAKATVYERVDNTNPIDIKASLATGFPVVFGASLYESFMSDEVAATGIIPFPQAGEKMIGGHCMCLVGYDDSLRKWIVANSWGAGWGLEGYCLMPYSYLTNPDMAEDFWKIEAES